MTRYTTGTLAEEIETEDPGIEVRVGAQGRGPFPKVGQYVTDDGRLYRVVSLGSAVHTGGPGADNYVYGRIVPADWSDCAEGEEIPASIVRE